MSRTRIQVEARDTRTEDEPDRNRLAHANSEAVGRGSATSRKRPARDGVMARVEGDFLGVKPIRIRPESEVESEPEPQAASTSEEPAQNESSTAESADALLGAFAAAPPSQKAAEYAQIQARASEAAAAEQAAFSEALLEFNAKLPGETELKSPGLVEAPAPSEIADEPARSDDGAMPEVEVEAAAQAAEISAAVTSPARLDLPESSADRAQARADGLQEGLGAVNIRNPDISTTPGPAPRMPRRGATRPERVGEEKAREQRRANRSLEAAAEKITSGARPEDPAPRAQGTPVAVGELRAPALAASAPIAEVDKFKALVLEPAHVEAFDQAQGPQMTAQLGGAKQAAEQARLARDTGRQAAIDEAKTAQDAANREAGERQEAALIEARGSIRSEKNTVLDAQRAEVDALGDTLDTRQKDARDKIEQKVVATEASVEKRYAETEVCAEAEVRTAEKKARAEKEA